jgi:hypothetical protein
MTIELAGDGASHEHMTFSTIGTKCGWSGIKGQLVEPRRRARLRIELLYLSDQTLRDSANLSLCRSARGKKATAIVVPAAAAELQATSHWV